MSRYQPIAVTLSSPSGAQLRGGEWPGSGVPVLGVQGLGSNHRVWELLARVAPELRIIATDARGRASGYGVPSPDGITTHADDLVAVLDDAGIERAVLVGHSMGGFVGLRFAQRHADRLHGLVLLDGGAPVKLPGILKSPRAVRFAFNRQLPKARDYSSFEDYWAFATKRSGTYLELDPEFVQWGFSIDLAGPEGKLRPQQDRPMLIDDAVECFTSDWRAEALRTLTMPTRLLLAASGATKAKKPMYRQLPDAAALSPTVEVERVPGTDHLDLLWHPRTIAAISSLVAA